MDHADVLHLRPLEIVTQAFAQRRGDFLDVGGRAAVCVMAVLLSGCAGMPGGLHPPAAALMVPPAALEDERVGEDLVERTGDLRRSYGQCTAKLKGLQRYARTVTQ